MQLARTCRAACATCNPCVAICKRVTCGRVDVVPEVVLVVACKDVRGGGGGLVDVYHRAVHKPRLGTVAAQILQSKRGNNLLHTVNKCFSWRCQLARMAAAAVWGMWYLWFALPQQTSVCVRSLGVPGACRFLRVA